MFVGDHLTGEKLFSFSGSPYVVCLLVTILLEKKLFGSSGSPYVVCLLVTILLRKSCSAHLALHTLCVVDDYLTREKLFSSPGSPYVVCLLVTILLEKKLFYSSGFPYVVCLLVPSYWGKAVQFTWLSIRGVFVGDRLPGEKLFSSPGCPYVVCLLVTILLGKSCSHGSPQVACLLPLFMFLLPSYLMFLDDIREFIVSVPDHCHSRFISK